MITLHVFLQLVIDHTFIFLELILFQSEFGFETDCVSERFPVGELSHLSKSSSTPLCKAYPGCDGIECSCGYVCVCCKT